MAKLCNQVFKTYSRNILFPFSWFHIQYGTCSYEQLQMVDMKLVLCQCPNTTSVTVAQRPNPHREVFVYTTFKKESHPSGESYIANPVLSKEIKLACKMGFSSVSSGSNMHTVSEISVQHWQGGIFNSLSETQSYMPSCQELQTIQKNAVCIPNEIEWGSDEAWPLCALIDVLGWKERYFPA